MSLDEQAISSIKEYFEAIALNALDDTCEAIDNDITFEQFMETLFQKLNRFSSEHVAAEILHLSPTAIANYNSGGGLFVDDVQELIDTHEDFDPDDEEDEDEDEDL